MERLGKQVPITEATVQEIQLELLRRTSFNTLDGAQVAHSLLRNRDLWQAVMLDRHPHWSVDYEALPALWLIKLRELPNNFWGADTQFILTDEQTAPQLLEVIEAERGWGGEIKVCNDQDEVCKSLGRWRANPPNVLITIWWD